MTGNPLISIIMPVYKVEKYLSTAIDSIISQAYKNFELILVDDCSPDKSGEICDEYAKKDSRIKVVHKQKNAGLGEARKTGTEYTSGDWLMFADSDDWLSLDALDTLYSKVSDDTDIAVFGFSMRYENYSGEAEYSDSRLPCGLAAEAEKDIGTAIVKFDDGGTFPYMCNKLYRANFLKNSGVRFNSIQSMEDFFFNIELFPLAKKIISIEKSLYNYRKPKHETLVTAYNPEFFELCKKRFFAEKDCIVKLGADTPENLQCIYGIYVKHMVTCFSRLYSKNTPLSVKEKKSKAKEYLCDETTESVLAECKPSSFKIKLFKSIFKTKSVYAAVFTGKTFDFIKTRCGKIYSSARK